MASIAKRMRDAGHADRAEKLLRVAAQARPGKAWEAVLTAVDAIATGDATSREHSREVPTVKAFGGDWHSGKLHTRYPDHVNAKDSRRDKGVATNYVDPVIGDLRVDEVDLDDCDGVMASLPATLKPASRRHVAQYLRRLFTYAVYPGRFRPANPIPRGWLPRVKQTKALSYIFPDEDRMLLACTSIDLVRRLYYGALAREGMRPMELARLRWKSLDLVRGGVSLDKNKTRDPRRWALDPGVALAFRLWRRHFRPDAAEDDFVFTRDDGRQMRLGHLVDVFRDDLKAAGVSRTELFEASDERIPIRVQDLRATFVTLSLARERSETWVQDRTGHKSTLMIQKYRRGARTWAETETGGLDDLATALPELAAFARHHPATPATRPIPGHLGSARLVFYAVFEKVWTNVRF